MSRTPGRQPLNRMNKRHGPNLRSILDTRHYDRPTRGTGRTGHSIPLSSLQYRSFGPSGKERRPVALAPDAPRVALEPLFPLIRHGVSRWQHAGSRELRRLWGFSQDTPTNTTSLCMPAQPVTLATTQGNE